MLDEKLTIRLPREHYQTLEKLLPPRFKAPFGRAVLIMAIRTITHDMNFLADVLGGQEDETRRLISRPIEPDNGRASGKNKRSPKKQTRKKNT